MASNNHNQKATPLVDSGVLQVRLTRARTDNSKSQEAVETYRKQLVSAYGVEIRCGREQSNIGTAATRFSWHYGRQYHQVVLHPSVDTFCRPHQFAHELTHIALASETHKALGNVPRFGVQVAMSEDKAVQKEAITESEFKNLGGEVAVEDQWKQQILSTAFDRILDMVVEQQLRNNPVLNPLSAAQFLSLHAHIRTMLVQLESYRQFCTTAPPSQLPSEHLAGASLAIDCANALFVDRLLGKFTHYFSAFTMTFDNDNAKRLAETICDFVQGRIPGMKAADEYKLVDDVMSMAGLNGLYDWG